MEELRRLQESFDSFSEKNHETQLKMTEQLAILTTRMESVCNELSRLNKHQQELPKNIQTEINNNKAKKNEKYKSVWVAPIVTVITVAIVGALILYFMGIG